MTIARTAMKTMRAGDLADVWRRHGVCVVEGFLPGSTVSALRRRLEDLRASCAAAAPATCFDASDQSHGSSAWFRESGGEIRAFFEPDMPPGLERSERANWVNKLGHALHDEDGVVASVVRDARLAELVAQLGCEDPLLVQSMAIFKEAGVGDAVPCHQDATFLATEPHSVIGLWFALDDADLQNGCLWVAPGHHMGPLGARYVRTAGGLEMREHCALQIPERDWVPVPASAGDLVLFHGFLPHRSERNASSRSRWALTLHVVSGRAHWCEDNWLQRTKPFRGFRAR